MRFTCLNVAFSALRVYALSGGKYSVTALVLVLELAAVAADAVGTIASMFMHSLSSTQIA